MPRRRKIDLLPSAIRDWLREELAAQGFADYDTITDALNDRLAEKGLLVTIGRSTVQRFGQEHREFSRLQQEATGWAAGWLDEIGLEEEARRQSVLFEMITTVAFKVMKAQMTREAGEIDPRDLHFLGRMMKDVMSSSGLREAMADKERKRLAEAERRAGGERAGAAARGAGLSPDVAALIRQAVEGGDA
ncbi:phage protein Gp27 family protein [Ruegeria sp.]|uniref:phage protein Gp27 family protein n=1 Tax=Ruegeria sp. TaxID=1879320 RepID=UPI003B00155B